MHRYLVLPALLFAAFAHAEDQTRSVAAFHEINIKGPVSIAVEVGKTQSVVISGDAKFQQRVTSEVVDGQLMIGMRDKHESMNISDGQKITITLPKLSKFMVEGAGEAVLSNISGERLELVYKGAGRLQAKGSVKALRINAQGVGEVDTKALLAQQADVTFEGVGAVKVYASERLNAVVRGMGSLNYYGNPRSVTKSVQGIGSVSAGD